MQHSRPPLERMLRIHQALAAGGYPNCRVLARQLEVAGKTIQRDLDFMRDRLGLPLAYDAGRHGFFYTAPVADFPSLKITHGEVAALLLAQKALEQYRGTPFEKPLASAFHKLSQALGGEMELAWHDLEKAVSFRSAGGGIADLKVFDLLARAVLQGEEVEFEYGKLGSAGPELRRVQPYHLGCIENQWYLFAFDLKREAVRTFALPRITGAVPTGHNFQRPKGFSVAKMLASSFTVYEGTPQRVRVVFAATAACLVRERLWHRSQRVRELGGGKISLEMEVALSPDLTAWLLGWGDQAEVISPAALRREVAEAASAVAALYRRGA